MNKAVLMFGLSFVAAGALTASLVGCSGTDHVWPASDQLQQGVTILSATPEVGVSGAYKKGTAVVYFQTRRGAMRPDFHRQQQPELGDYELDGRFLDARGNTIVIAQAGDQLVDKTWAEEFRKQELKHQRLIDDDARNLAAEAATAIASHPFHQDVTIHQSALIALGQAHLATSTPDPGVYVPAPAQEKGLGDNYVGGATYEIHYKNIFCAFWSCAHHSSVHVAAASGAHYYSANHGSWSYQMGNVSCARYGTGGWFQEEDSTWLSTYNGGCATPYDWNAGGGYHNCHSDSMMQGYGVIYGYESTTAGVCSGLNWWAAPGKSGHPFP